jgi:general secretion pathway protein K
MKTTDRSAKGFHRGVALLAVIWLLAVLALATITTLRVITFDIEVASAKIHGLRARHVAEMGIAVGSNPVVKRSDPILRSFDEGTGEGFDVRIVSEGSRFNINAILLKNDTDLLRSMFIDWGLELDDSQAVVDALVDWVDGNDELQLNGAEVGEYEELGRINQPFNRPFYDLSEMRLVLGMEWVEAVRPDWREWFTIWSGGALDLNDAPAELIAAAAEVRIEVAEAIPEAVRGPDGLRDTEDDVPFENAAAALDLLGVDANGRPDIVGRFTVNDTTTRIESIGQAEGAKRKITAIVRNRTGKPALLERTEEIIP